MAAWFYNVLDMVLPPACAACRRPGAWWCEDCATRVVSCSQPVSGRSGDLAGVLAGAYFREPLSAAVKSLKYRHARMVGTELVKYLESPLSRILKTCHTNDALLVPIPLHASRQRSRGHNQAAVLAKLLSERSRVPWQDALRRTRPTHTQTTLHRDERFANVAGAFELAKPLSRDQTVILIDDVVTTGATFKAAAQAIRTSGVDAVWGLAVAHRERP